jgi:hypothetical protein
LHSLTLSIAGFTLLLESENISDLGLEMAYLPFEIKNHPPPHDVKITSVRGIPASLSPKELPKFEAQDAVQKYFSVYTAGDSYKIIVYNPLHKNKIQQIALLSGDFMQWTIYVDDSEKNKEIFPLLYPMGPLVLYYLTVNHEAVMMHASGISDGKKGRIFTGFSGNGKTTLAALWQTNGSLIVNDDRLIIRREAEGYFIYNTPMFYTDVAKRKPLHALYIIEHAVENRLVRLKGARAVSGLMAYCIQHAYHRHFIEHHLGFLYELCNQLPVYQLGFVPDNTVIDFIKTHGV